MDAISTLARITLAEAEAITEAERIICRMLRHDAERTAKAQPQFITLSQKDNE